MRYNNTEGAVALIYAKERSGDEKLFKFMEKIGVECKFEDDFTQLDAHIKQYNPDLIFSPKLDIPISQSLLDDEISFLFSKQDGYRQLAYSVLNISEEQWRLLLCDTALDTLYKFLWYVCDAEIIKLVLSHFTLRTAQYVMEELEKKYSNIAHSQAIEELIQEAVEATLEIFNQCHELSLLEEAQ